MNKTFVYIHKTSLYINLTNSCTNSCDFCIRNGAEGVSGYDLWLEKEPDIEDVIKSLEGYNVGKFNEVVFCGYGEPTVRLDVLLDISRYIKENYHNVLVRINTNGQANLIHNKDVTPMFKGLIDELSISLNAPTAEEYQKICKSEFGETAYDSILKFARLAKEHVDKVRFTVVDIIGNDKIKECKEISDAVGVPLYVRKGV